MKFNTSSLSPMALGRLNKALDTCYSFSDGVCTLRQKIESLHPIVKEETDGMVNWNRRHANNLAGSAYEEYEARLKAKRLYYINDLLVPKIVYDAVD
jgi:hypothetical protein